MLSAAVWTAVVVLPSHAAADSGGISTFATNPSMLPINATFGPDGAIWFTWVTGASSQYGLGRMTISGSFTSFPMPASWTTPSVAGLTAANGALWVLEMHDGQSFVGQWSTSGSLVHEFHVPGKVLSRITYAPDGTFWYTAAESLQPPSGALVGEMTPGGAVTTTSPASTAHIGTDIVVAPDYALWVEEPEQFLVARVSAANGAFTDEYQMPNTCGAPSCGYAANADDTRMTEGPDGAVWFTGLPRVVRVTTTGGVTTYPSPVGTTSAVSGLTETHVWVASADAAGSYVSLMSATTSPVVYQTPVDPGTANIVLAASDGTVWTAESGSLMHLDPRVAQPVAQQRPPETAQPSPSAADAVAPTTPPAAAETATPSTDAGVTWPSESPQAGSVSATTAASSQGGGVTLWVALPITVLVIAAGAGAWFLIRRGRGTPSGYS